MAPRRMAAPVLATAFSDQVIPDRTPLGRFATAEEVAAGIAFLLLGLAPHVNGAVLEVDGGLTAGYLTHRPGAGHALPGLATAPKEAR